MSVDDLKSGKLTGASPSDLSYPLYDFLKSLVPLQAFAVLIIDETQNLSPPLLEEIRILSDLESPEKLLQLVLVGQLELRAKLKLPELRQLDQRVSARCSLQALTREAVSGYISHRLAVAGGTDDRVYFTPPAVDALFHASGGVPRLINLICDRALYLAHLQRKNVIDPSEVARSIEELGVGNLTAAPAQDETPAPTPEVTAAPPVLTEPTLEPPAPTSEPALALISEATPAANSSRHPRPYSSHRPRPRPRQHPRPHPSRHPSRRLHIQIWLHAQILCRSPMGRHFHKLRQLHLLRCHRMRRAQRRRPSPMPRRFHKHRQLHMLRCHRRRRAQIRRPSPMLRRPCRIFRPLDLSHPTFQGWTLTIFRMICTHRSPCRWPASMAHRSRRSSRCAPIRIARCWTRAHLRENGVSALCAWRLP